MAEFLLVHGSCHGAWCWAHVIPLLQAMGHQVQAIDLPGHGDDQTPVEAVTLEAYADAIAGACGQETQLVGHSMGGYAIAAAARLVPEKIAKLIYLCAYVPQEGVSLAQMRMQAPRQPLLPAVRMRDDGISFTLDPKMAKDIFYHDCPRDIAEEAIARLCPQAVAPTSVPFVSTPQQAALPRHYIRCMDDRTIPPEFQVTMTQGWARHTVEDMACGHSPFLADPEGLAQRLDRATRG
ncbi:MAG: alpha/beta fold hydrolase [Pseudomonadota bacterium]